MNFNDHHDFTFEEDAHLYRSGDGQVRLSITQMLSKVGIYDFSHVPPAILENARRRGSNVHRWCAELDIYGFVDETWIADDEMPYVEAWLKFKRETGLVVRQCEVPMMAEVAGMVFGGTPDVIGYIGSQQFVIERKACRAKHPGWAVQTALQEMLVTRRPRVGHLERMTVQLMPDAKYKAHSYQDKTDGDVGLAILQKFGAEQSIANWMHNRGLKQAA